MQLQFAQLQADQPLEGGQVGLVVRVGHGLSDRGVPLGYAGSLPIDRGTPLGFPGPVGTWWPADPGEGGPHPLRGQVLDPAVVLVAAHVLADRAGQQVADRPQSLVHVRRAYGGPARIVQFPC